MSLATCCILFVAIQAHFMLSEASYYNNFIQKLFYQTTGSTCRGSGYEGCCANCMSTDGTCYCDEICHQYDDCCSDIFEINCLPASVVAETSRTMSPPPTNCVSAGFNGCCSSSNCSVPAGNCSCDGLCHVRGDCCSDIGDINCQAPPTCSLDLSHTSGCCTGRAFQCRVRTPNSRGRFCYCNKDCHKYNDCCADIDLIGCHEATKATNCTTAGHTNECCTGGLSACSVNHNGNMCACDVGCYQEGNCCEDIMEINCLPRGCRDAGKLGCTINEAINETCRVNSSSGVCFCNPECLNTFDCCPDATILNTQSDIALLYSRRLKELSKQMAIARIQGRQSVNYTLRHLRSYLAALQQRMDEHN